MMTNRIRHTGRGVRAAAAGCVLALALVSSGDALAQGSAAARKASADMLFDEAKKLMKDGNFAQACPKFEASQKLDPAIGTLLNLGNCYEKAGKVASAWATFNEAADVAKSQGDARRQEEATNRAATLRPKLPTLTIALEPGAKVDGLKVLADDVEIQMEAIGTPVPLDPGDHMVHVSAPGKKAWIKLVKLEVGATSQLTIPVLQQDDKAASGAAAGTEPSPTGTAGPAPVAPGQEKKANTQKIIGISLIGLGAVAVVTGGVLAGTAKSAWNDARSRCPENQCSSQDDIDKSNSARSQANVAGIVLGVGVVSAVAGGALWFLASRKPSNRPQTALSISPMVGPGSAFVGMSGGF